MCELKQRNNIIQEIRVTEGDYVKDLDIIVRVFSQELQRNGIIPKSDVTALFSNVSVLLSVNTNLNNELVANNDDKTILIGKIFADMVNSFDCSLYCST